MQYLLLIYQAEELWENMSSSEKESVMARHMQLHERMEQDGVEWVGQPLMPTSTSVSVRSLGSEQVVSDGPFAETKEQLAGFYMVDVADVSQAVALASLLQEAELGTVEVRPVADHSANLPK